jgi:hypothetical protein
MYELLLVLLGAVLGLPVAIIANIYNDRILEKLEHFKLSRHGKRRDKALVEYRRLCHLHHGTRDKHAYTLSQLTRIITIFVMGLYMLVLVSTLGGDVLAQEYSITTRYRMFTVGSFLVFLTTLAGFVIAERFRSDLRKLYGYETYEAAMVAKWKFTDQEINPH